MSYPAFHIYFYPLLGSSIITPDQNSLPTSNQTTSVHKLSISTLFWAVLFQPQIKTHSITPKSNHLRPQIVSIIYSLSSPVQSLNLADINFIRYIILCIMKHPFHFLKLGFFFSFMNFVWKISKTEVFWVWVYGNRRDWQWGSVRYDLLFREKLIKIKRVFGIFLRLGFFLLLIDYAHICRLENYCGGTGEKLQGISLWPTL